LKKGVGGFRNFLRKVQKKVGDLVQIKIFFTYKIKGVGVKIFMTRVVYATKIVLTRTFYNKSSLTSRQQTNACDIELV
jgi:hypothetical protein